MNKINNTQTIQLYGCGGTGINICNRFKDLITPDDSAMLNPVFVDTSHANITDAHLEEEDFFHITRDKNSVDPRIGRTDGGGKLRLTNLDIIANKTGELLIKFPPTAFNIVVHSGGGASGAMIGYNIVKNLLERDIPVMVIVVGSITSSKETDNTVATLRTYQALCTSSKKPLVVSYYEVDESNTETVIDNDVERLIKMLGVLFSGKNKRLDSADLRNWIFYNNVVDTNIYQPTLAKLIVRFGTGNKTSDTSNIGVGKVVSVASLVPEGGSKSLGANTLVEYSCDGIISQELADKISDGNTIHFMLVVGIMVTKLNDLLALKEKNAEIRASLKHEPLAITTGSSDCQGEIFL